MRNARETRVTPPLPRENFAEEPGLKQLLARHACCEQLSAEAFHSGEWRQAILRASKLRPSFEGKADGGRACATQILDYLRAHDDATKSDHPAAAAAADTRIGTQGC